MLIHYLDKDLYRNTGVLPSFSQFLQLGRFLDVRIVSYFISKICFPKLKYFFPPILRHFSLSIALEDLVSVRKCWRYKTSYVRMAKIKCGKSQECISEIETELLFPYCLILERICNTDIFPGKKTNIKAHF